jgi:hypothetical protein
MSKAHNKPTGDKTHDQRIAIIEKRVNTKNGGAGFDAEADLTMPPEEHAARLRGASLDTERRPIEEDDRSILRGEHQESVHGRKHGAG